MAKCVVTFTDGPTGEVTMKIEFDPPAKTDDDLTTAQAMGCRLALMLQEKHVSGDE